MTWLLLAIAAPLFWAVSNVIDTVMRRRFVHDDATLMWVYATFRLPLVLILFALLFWGFFEGFEFPGHGVGWAMLAVGSLWTLAFIPYFRALRIEEPSRVILFLQFLSIFSFVWGYFILGETLALQQAMAFLVLLGGGVLAGIKKWEGVWSFSREAFFLMMGASFFWALADVLFKRLSFSFEEFIPAFTLFFMGSFLPGPVLLLVPTMRRKVRIFFRGKLPLQAWGLIIMTLITGSLGSIAFAYALILGKVSLTSVLSDLQPLFVFSFTLLLAPFFKAIDSEDVSKQALLFKGLSILMITAGIVLLYY